MPIPLKNISNRNNFKNYFEAYYSGLCRFALNYVDSSIAEDFVQEAFSNLWEKREKIAKIDSVKAFLYTSVRNACLNHLKHLKVQEKNQQDLIIDLTDDSFFTEHIIEEEVYRQLIADIKQLPEQCKQITLLALNGLKNPEIAEELKVSVNTVKTQKKLAYKKLRHSLQGVLKIILFYF